MRRTRSRPAAPSRARRAGSRASVASASASRRVAGRDQDSGLAVHDQLGDAPIRWRRRAGPCSAPPSARWAGRRGRRRAAIRLASTNRSAGDSAASTASCGLRAAPVDPVGEARAARPRPSAPTAAAPPPIWIQRQRRSGGSRRQARRAARRSPSSRPRGRPRAGARVGRIAPVARGRRDRRRREAGEIEAVIDQRTRSGSGASSARCSWPTRGAGDGPAGLGQLLAQLPLRRRPDVLGVRRDGPGQAADQRGVARDRGRRVQEVRVDPGRSPGGSSGASTQAWPKRRPRLRVGSRVRSSQPEVRHRRPHSRAAAGPSRQRAPRRAPARRADIPAGTATGAAMLAVEVVHACCRSDGAARRSAGQAAPLQPARISWAMKVSDRRGIALQDDRGQAVALSACRRSGLPAEQACRRGSRRRGSRSGGVHRPAGRRCRARRAGRG